MLYGEPPVASTSSGPSFPEDQSPHPGSIPLLSVSVPAPDIPLPSSETSDSDEENSSLGSFQSTQQVVMDLVEIMEADPEVNGEEAQVLSNTIDAEVRSHLYQQCKLKNYPEWFLPYPKGCVRATLPMTLPMS